MTLQNKIQNEMTAFKNELLKKDKQMIYDQAFKITTYENAEVFFMHDLDFLTKKELDHLNDTDEILFQFHNYFSELESGEIDEEMIKEFLNYIS
ncbi:hypothetical protein SAMN04488700_0146 [Carnobacterium iners]|uniref:Uncharacterized protein n=1 Tax=Carnobacterium iners TaxID=1073423 RepID=A0A1X7MQ56_9LACT|nr:hypothetical protein [Carnobacterium iners]SEK78286.1 hypothetical protein SAMN04488114_11149 [Carnobacterium iners]SMH26481.1 hypothetical protein SAMN04488700_0146 [Carnobacterium iners]